MKTKKQNSDRTADILIVEDSPTQAMQLQHLLEQHNYQVTSAENGIAALTLLEKYKPAIVISDVIMSEMDGFELCKTIKTDDRLKTIPVVLLTNLTKPENLLKGLMNGASHFITKPYSEKFLITQIQSILKNRELRQKPVTDEDIEIFFKGKKHSVTSDRLQLLDLLFSTFEGVVQKGHELESTNRELKQTRDELKKLNKQLESKVMERTERIAHLNSVLNAVRSVNQLIVREKNRDRLLKAACDSLISTRGFNNACITLLNQSGEPVETVEAGFDMEFLPIVEMLKHGELAPCIKKTISRPEAVVINDHCPDSVDCPLRDILGKRVIMSTRLQHGVKVYGLIMVSMPGNFTPDEEERALFNEVTGDIAYALYNIEIEENHRKAEEALRESEEKFRTIVLNAQAVIFMIDKDGTFLLSEGKGLSSLGLKPGEAVGKSAFEMYKDYPEIIKGINEAIDGKVLKDIIEVQGIVFDIIYAPYFDSDGNVLGVIGIAIDITERKKAEEELSKKSHDLGERVKELRCLYGISNLFERPGISLEEIIQGTVDLIPPGWQYPESTCARIIIRGEEYTMRNFKKTPWKQASEIKVYSQKAGVLEVYYLEEKPELDEGPFLKEERSLINVIAERLGRIAERKQVEEELKNSKDGLAEAQRIAHVGNWELDLGANEIKWSDEIYRIFGLKPQEFGATYEAFLSFIHPDDRAFVDTAYQESVKHNTPYDIVHRITRPDGGVRYVHEKAEDIKNEKGETIRSVGTVQDITEQKIAEEELSKERNLLRTLIDNLPDLIYVKDAECRFVMANTAVADISGTTTEDLIGKTDYDYFSKEIAEKFYANEQEVMRSGRAVIQREERMVDARGKYRCLSTTQVPLRDNHGKIVGLVGMGRDITEHKQAEEELRKLSQAVEQSQVSVVITDTEGKIEYVNPRFTEVTGYTSEEAIGKNPRILKSGEHNSEFYDQLWGSIIAGREWRGEFHNRKKNGELYYESMSISPIKDAESVITHFLAVRLDITEQKKLKEQLIQSQKMEAIGLLAGGVAHDFNNLLCIIIGYSDLILSRMDKQSKAHKEIEEIRDAGQRAASLTAQLLVFSRRQILTPKELDLNAVAAEMKKMLGRLIGEDIELVTVFEQQLWNTKADRGQIEQVLMNLVVNARDSMTEGGRVSVRTDNKVVDSEYCRLAAEARPGKYVCLSVEDTGSGMSKETISHIFEPFYTTKKEGRGTGLGLSVIYGIVKQHEGWINVYSEPGEGSVFRVYLPALLGKGEEEAEEEEVSIEELKGGGERVLVVEDEERLREFATRMLRENGYVIYEAGSAGEALKVFEREGGRFQLLFSDVVLPDRNGVELVGQLIDHKPGLNVLLSSGYLDSKSQLKTIREKGYCFVQKPYTLTGLLKAVKKTIK